MSNSATSIESITFDVDGCTLAVSRETERGWMSPEQVFHYLRYDPSPSPYPFDLSDFDTAHNFYSEMSEKNGGVMLSLEPDLVRGKEVVHGIFKYSAAGIGNGLGMLFTGIIFLPFEDCNFQFNIESAEFGMTGMREVAVKMLLGSAWPNPEGPPKLVSSGEELFAEMRKSRSHVKELPSDQECYDEKFPDHPLSKVRRRVKDALKSMSFDESLLNKSPFRLK